MSAGALLVYFPLLAFAISAGHSIASSKNAIASYKDMQDKARRTEVDWSQYKPIEPAPLPTSELKLGPAVVRDPFSATGTDTPSQGEEQQRASAKEATQSGKANFKAHKYEQAISDFNRAIELDPNEISNYYYQTGIYLVTNQTTESLIFFDKAYYMDAKIAPPPLYTQAEAGRISDPMIPVLRMWIQRHRRLKSAPAPIGNDTLPKSASVSTTQDNRATRIIAALDKEIPDWIQINGWPERNIPADPKWQQFLGSVANTNGQTYQQLLDFYVGKGDTLGVVNIFRLFKQSIRESSVSLNMEKKRVVTKQPHDTNKEEMKTTAPAAREWVDEKGVHHWSGIVGR